MVKKNFYLKLLMSLLLVALAIPQGKAETLVVGDQSATNQYVPFYSYYMDMSYDLFSQSIYSVDLLNDIRGKKITAIKFHPQSPVSSNINGAVVQISLKETSQSTFVNSGSNLTPSYNTITGMTVYGTCTLAKDATELVFNLNTPFEYTGNENLSVEVRMTTSSSGYDSNGLSFYGKSQTANVTYYRYGYSSQDVTTFLPKTTFVYESAGPKPTLSADPTSLSFNAVVGNPVTNTVTVTGANLTGNISAAIVDDTNNAYSIDVNSITANGNAQGTITVTYNPSAAGTHTATLRLTSDGATAVDVPLTGTATAPAVPTIIVNPATLTINTEPYTAGSASFTVTGTNLTSDISLSVQGSRFAVVPNTITAANAANGVPVTVTYSAQEIGTFQGTVTLTSGDVTKTVDVTANVNEVVAEGTVTPTSLNFGEVLVGQTSEAQLVKVSNTGSDAFTPSFSIDNPAFSIDEPTTITGGTSISYNVTFTPTAAGVQTGVLTVSFGGLNHTVALTGQGKELAAYDITSSAASGVHNFGDVFKDGIATWNVTLTNNGANAVTPTIEGLAAPFSAENVPATLAAGKSATITFKFAPTAIQAYGPTSIVVKFAETTAFQFDYTFRGNGIEDTGTLPPSSYEAITYTWTDSNGNEHTSKLTDIATDPDQMIALMREVYTNKNLPGPWYRGYDESGNTETAYPVAYPAIGTVSRFGTFGVTENYTYDGTSNGWNIPHNEADYPFDLLYHNSSSHNYYKALNGNEYKPNKEGLTLLLVEMKDGVNSSTVSNTASLRNVFDGMFKSVRVIPNSKRVTKNGVEGTLFKIDCDKMNRFFFLGKGRLRLYNDAYVDNTHLLGRSNFFIDKDNQTSSSLSITNVTDDKAPFYEMFEQFSPVSLTHGTESKDVYQELINMASYPVEHDCEYIPWATTQSSSGASITGHEFNMYGKESISDDCQDVRDLMFFVPDQRMKYWDSRDKGGNDKFVNYYEEYAPTMGLYVIRQNPITGEKIDGQYTYKLHLTWDSNLTDFVPENDGVYYIYQVNEDGSYTKVGQTNSQTKELYLDVNMAEHGQQVTYVIQGRDNTGFLSLQFSNEESFIIPGTNPYEKFQLEPNADYYSRFNPADGYNYYANGLQIKNYVAGLSTSDLAGKKLMFYRQALNQSTWTKVAEVEISGTTGTATMFEQRAQSDYKFGFKTNPELVVSTTDNYYNFGTAEKPFMVYDNLKDDVSLNIHPDGYRYKVVVDGTPDENTKIHSNVITIRVYKTNISAISGTFTAEQVENDAVRTLGIESPSFDIDVEHSSKTEVLRYDAYRWGSEDDKNIIDPSSSVDNEQDIAPNGIAGNQGEYYTVAMNSDYVGNDVYVEQGQTAQATFVDNVPMTNTAADEYWYAPVVEVFAPAGWGRDDYNTYGGPQQSTAIGKIAVSIENNEASGYTWQANGNTYRYYNVFLDVQALDLPAGYEVAKVRAWRKIDPSYLGEQAKTENTADYTYRLDLDRNGEYMFDEKSQTGDNDKLGSEEESGFSQQNKIYRGTFGAIDVKNGATIPMKFFVRVYFKKSGSKAANEYYITEVEVDGELNSQIPTSIFGVQSYKVVTGIKYYNLAGIESDVPFQGVNIEVTTYEDGSRTTRKIMK